MEFIGKYKVLAHIGHGAMGSVEKAEAPDGTIVAIKTLFPQFVYEEEYVKRFKREAELAKKLSHPNVVKILEIGEDNEGRRQYIVMEYIDGKSLAESMHDKGMASVAIKRSSKLNEEGDSVAKDTEISKDIPQITTFTAEETIKIIRQLAGVLQAADDISLLHRDVKPQNILLDKKGNAKLLDFGLAKDTEALVSMLSMTGQSIGTPPYMSPEQHEGQKDIDIRSDLYSLGCTAYQMLTGKAPFPGPTASAFARQHCDDIPEPVHKVNPKCPLNLSQLIDRLLAKNPKNRHNNPAELIEDLNRVERGEVPLKLYKPKKSKKHNPVKNWLTVAAAVIIVAGCFWGWDFYRKNNAVTIIKESMSDAKQLAVEHKFRQAKDILDSIISEYAISNPEPIKKAEALRTQLIEQHGKWLAGEAARKRHEQGNELTRTERIRKRMLHNCLRNAARLKKRENRVKEAEKLVNKAYQLCNTDAERAKVAIIEKKVREALAKIRPWAAVADFTLDKSVKVDLSGSAVAVKLEQALGRKYRLVTRNQVKKALRELRFQSSDLADKGKAKQFGKLVGAEYLISGSVIQLGREVTVACQIFNIETGAIRQTAEVSASNVNDFNYMIRDAAKILAMSNAEKIKYVERLNSSKRTSGRKYPQIASNFIKKITVENPFDKTIPGLGMKLVYVAPGSFMMGSNDGKTNEKPVHKVIISNPYWIGKYEVSQEEYKTIMGTNPGSFKANDEPVNKVNWHMAVEFCKKLNDQERKAGRLPSGYEYRLPTEAEWEFAARGGNKSKNYKYSGSNDIDKVAWYNRQWGNVGTKAPNELGIYDMSGNVWEWCNDWYGRYNNSLKINPTGPSIATNRIIRGGCWRNDSNYCRVARHYSSSPDAKGSGLGFRIALAPIIVNNKIALSTSIDKTIPGLGMKLVYVTPGSFMMGANDGKSNEKPIHKVTISTPYWIGKYEVTHGEYQAVMKDDLIHLNLGKKPVNSINWHKAVEFCKKLTAREKNAGRLPAGYEYRLPTEAEWEFAARGGIKSRGYKYSGSNIPDNVMWHSKNSGGNTYVVGSKLPNELGIYDMSGNVWEWCLDNWHDNYTGAPTDGNTWDIGKSSAKIIRGASWYDNSSDWTLSSRNSNSPQNAGVNNIGFRIVLGTSPDDNNRTIPGLGMELVHVASGSFMMGSNDGEKDERPMHKVTISNPYWIGKYEVTQNEYIAIMGTNPSMFKDTKNPVEQVTWNDATNFCQKINEQEKKAGRLPAGYEYRLPTEAEWEFAARGGNKSKGYVYSGSNDIDKVVWYYENSGDKKLYDYSWSSAKVRSNNCRTHNVGLKIANELGIHDMNGNVKEWCVDFFANYPDSSVIDPVGKGSHHVYRSGGWANYARCSRITDRGRGTLSHKAYMGLRLALAPIITDGKMKSTVVTEKKTAVSNPLDKTIPELGLKLVHVEPGNFIKGSNDGESSKVKISKAYWIGKYEVTQQEYQSIMGTNPSRYKKQRQPVEQVSWNDAVKFCQKLTEQEKKAKRLPVGYEFRLPTEAEWEFAARGGNKSKGCIYSGSNDIRSVAWNKHTAKKRPHEVGGKASNELGIHDMSGNVYEWCMDNWHDNYQKAPLEAAVPYLAPYNPARAYRSGGFLSPSRWCKISHRSQNLPDYKAYRLGFRVALAPVVKTIHAKVPDKIIPDLGMKLVHIAPGSFEMGSNKDTNSKPVRNVTIHKEYWIGKYEVTQNEYQKIMGTNPSRFKSPNKPVEKVSWHDAISFCKKLTKRERKAGRLPPGYTYQLPTEAEWEYAARGGKRSKNYKFSGSESLLKVAWTYKDSKKQTHEVGKKTANELGIYDMSGNVYEWCMDDWHADYSNAPSAANRWGKGNIPLRVRRGGGWKKKYVHQVTHRSYSPPSRKYDYLGFRIVLRTHHEAQNKIINPSILNFTNR